MTTSKPNLTRVWASGAPAGNVIDPDTTTPGKFDAGWLAEVPPFEHFNFLQQLFTQALAHINEQGVSSWDTNTEYPVNGLSKGSNGLVYLAIVEQSGNDPVSDGGTNWILNSVSVRPEYLGGDIQAAAALAEYSKLQLSRNKYPITAPITFTKGLMLEGVGSYGPTVEEGSIIENKTNDVESIIFDGTSTRIDRARVKDLRINHEAPTKYAMKLSNSPFNDFDNVDIECGGVGFGGMLLGDELVAPVEGAYLGGGRNVRIWNYTTYGVRVNSVGTTWNFTGWHVSSTVNGAIGGYFNKEAVHVIGGQWGANNTGGIGISDYNTSAGDREGGTFEKQVWENVSNKCVSFDGDTNSVVGGQLREAYANLVSVSGVVCFFGRAKHCTFDSPKIKNPTSGGTLCEWGENSRDCVLTCDLDAAKAPITVHASAIGAVKVVTGKISRTEVANITTDPNITVILRDGVKDMVDGFTPVHNGTAWNFQIFNLTDDTATSFVPPTKMGLVKVLNDDEAATFGIASYNADGATPECEPIAPGTAFDTTTGVLSGTTGANLFVTVSAATDGKVYIEARKGTSNMTIMFESVVFSV